VQTLDAKGAKWLEKYMKNGCKINLSIFKITTKTKNYFSNHLFKHQTLSLIPTGANDDGPDFLIAIVACLNNVRATEQNVA
jgi:hypothetical protein